MLLLMLMLVVVHRGGDFLVVPVRLCQFRKTVALLDCCSVRHWWGTAGSLGTTTGLGGFKWVKGGI